MRESNENRGGLTATRPSTGPLTAAASLVLLPRSRADVEPALVPSAETWLGMQREKRRVSRMRTVLDKIAEAVRSPGAMLNPPEMAGPLRPAQALHGPMRPMPVPAL